MVPRNILRRAAYLLLWPLSIPWANPEWPGPCLSNSVQTHPRVSIASAIDLGAASSHYQASCLAQTNALDTLIRRVPICITWTKSWAGELGSSLLYRTKRLAPDRVVVGYFAYWTTERAWGDNNLTHWLIPAVAIDSVYSHLFFVFPGVQRMLYGPGDVEGLRVTYKLENSEQLLPVSIVADDARHQEVTLDINQALDISGHIVVFNDVWSHQLGGKRAVSTARAGASQHCFGGNSLRSITDEDVAAFRLGSTEEPRRAGPAWGND